jgi:hypothetical protein
LSEKIYDNFSDLEARQLCNKIRQWIWGLTRNFPPAEKSRLSDQMIGVSRSSPATGKKQRNELHRVTDFSMHSWTV